MKIVAISDCHGHMPVVPNCDLILNAGDICPDFRGDRVMYQWQWMNRHYRDYLDALPAPMVAVWGNHDFVGEPSEFANTLNLPWTLLQDRMVEIQGLRIYGSPWSKRFYDWAFMRNEKELDRIYSAIPEGLDILIVHGPPYDACDANYRGELCGSVALRRHIERAQPRLVLCGHIHESAKREDYIDVSRIVNVCSLTRDAHGRELDVVPYVEFDMNPIDMSTK
jgi:Icc-related predicted phosphoesterase